MAVAHAPAQPIWQPALSPTNTNVLQILDKAIMRGNEPEGRRTTSVQGCSRLELSK
jgi:hypothetical protein